MENIRLVVGRSNEELGRGIAARLGVDVAKVEVSRHANSEIKVRIAESVRKKEIYVLGTGSEGEGNSVNDALMELLLTVDACKLSSAGSVAVIVPCYPYARADKKVDGRTSIGGALVARLMKAVGANRIVSMDLHAEQIQGFIDLPFDNLEAIDPFIEFIEKTYFGEMTKKERNEKYILVSPDGGGVKRVEKYAKKLEMNFVIMHKQRDYTKSSTVLHSVLVGAVDNVVGKTAIIIDDIIDTMGTMLSAANELHKKGIKNVIIMATHGILSGPAIDRINAAELITNVIVTNTLPQKNNQDKCPKLQVVDTSFIFAEVIRRLVTGESVSALFF